VPYHYEAQPIMELAKQHLAKNPRLSICAFCSRMRRGTLYTACRRYGYNVLALGQHLDDLAESFVMSSFHNGMLRTMKVHYVIGRGDVRVIRPLCFVRESKTREFAKLMGLPIINENCPACFEAPKERQRTKLMLAAQEAVHPTLFSSLQRTMLPLLRVTATGAGPVGDDVLAQVRDLLGISAPGGAGGDDDDGEDGDYSEAAAAGLLSNSNSSSKPRGRKDTAAASDAVAGAAAAAADAVVPAADAAPPAAPAPASVAAEAAAEHATDETQVLLV